MTNWLITGDCRTILPMLEAESVQCCVTSPPYWGLRDYGVDGQLGLEASPEEYVNNMVAVFREVRRVLRDDGTLWLNLGDSYARILSGFLKPKDLVGIPWRVAFALQADGWYLRSDIIWAKPNPMPEGVTDRPTKAHEYLFLLAKNQRYYYAAEAIAEEPMMRPQRRLVPHKTYEAPGARPHWKGTRYQRAEKGIDGPALRNRRTVWTIPTQPYPEAHFAVFPPALIEPCILAGSRTDDAVLDPFMGSGTTAEVAQRLGRKYIGIELNEDYLELQEKRTKQMGMAL